MLTEQFSLEYEEIKKIADTYPEIIEHITQDNTESFPFHDPAQMLLDLRSRMAKDFPALPGPDATVTVKNVSANLEPYCAPAFYLTDRKSVV